MERTKPNRTESRRNNKGRGLVAAGGLVIGISSAMGKEVGIVAGSGLVYLGTKINNSANGRDTRIFRRRSQKQTS